MYNSGSCELLESVSSVVRWFPHPDLNRPCQVYVLTTAISVAHSEGEGQL